MACPTCQLMRGILLSQGMTPSTVGAVGAVLDPLIDRAENKVIRVTKRKASAYSKKYGRAFKSVAHKYKLKSGKWAKNGFARAQKEAHRLAKRM
jgi:hypothetical protein